ncbi:hypothetical protein G6514_003236 [Epicoccum nigrum]|nr:hypothetical protein G6514_003236 [Epicoccum nigrum]
MNNSTCPEGNLEPSYWNRPDQYEYFKALNILLASNTTSPDNGSKPSGAVTAGAVVGSLGSIAIVMVAVFLLWRRKKHIQKRTAPPTYSPAQQIWAHSQTEVVGEDSKDSLRSPFTEVKSKSSPARIAELPTDFDAKELNATDVTPKPPQTELGVGVEEPASDLGEKTPFEPRTSTERH